MSWWDNSGNYTDANGNSPSNGSLLMGGLGDVLGGFLQSQMPNPASSAMPYLNQIGSSMSPLYQPYINAGNSALPTLQNQYGSLMNGNFINNMGQNFHQSPGYGFQVNQAENAANRAAAAGGMLGSPEEQQNISTTVNGLANQDYYNYLNHEMGAYGMGLQGEQGLYNTGFNASNELATNLAQALMSQANMAYAGQANQNQSSGGGLGSMISGLGSLGNIASFF